MNNSDKAITEAPAVDRQAGRADGDSKESISGSPTIDLTARAGSTIAASLNTVAGKLGGRAFFAKVGAEVNSIDRTSLAPAASFYTGRPAGREFPEGTPVFAAEVRSENDHGADVELRIIQKRNDYFQAGTLVVWDVDLLSDEVVRVYRAGDPKTPTIYRKGDLAEAEPAVPGWTMPVDALFQ